MKVKVVKVVKMPRGSFSIDYRQVRDDGSFVGHDVLTDTLPSYWTGDPPSVDEVLLAYGNGRLQPRFVEGGK